MAMGGTSERVEMLPAASPITRRLRRSARPICAALAVLLLFAVWRASSFPKRFGIVTPGAVYRSGELTPRSLERVAGECRLTAVLSLLEPDDPDSVAEREKARALGLKWLNVPLRGDGSSTPSERDEIRRHLLDEANRPLLIHCAAGANRTGLACGMLRIHREGWTVERVLEEMRGFGFDDLPKHENLRAALVSEYELAQRVKRGGDENAAQTRNPAASAPSRQLAP